ncbi:hypothetical protein [Bradyrhizobium sp. CER78]|nr:hypothetical protein [Bradyrhizobium sp. CER78]MDH2383203.1 hypothetical protein [Bradyrhizobium sp. CER78]
MGLELGDAKPGPLEDRRWINALLAKLGRNSRDRMRREDALRKTG